MNIFIKQEIKDSEKNSRNDTKINADITNTIEKDDEYPYQAYIKENNDEMIEEAERILKERSKNRGLSLTSRPKGKHAFITDTKDVCLKNYLIGLLKDERTNLSDKESSIKGALESSDRRLEYDLKFFIEFVEKEKEKIKENESKIVTLISANKAQSDKLNLLKNERKGLFDESERVIRQIENLKDISKFVHKLLDPSVNSNKEKSNSMELRSLKYDADYEDDENYIKIKNEAGNTFSSQSYNKNIDIGKVKIEKKTEEIIKEFAHLDINSKITSNILSDHTKLISKFKEIEDKILKMMEKREESLKESTKMQEKHFEELDKLEKIEKNLQEELKRLKLILKKEEKNSISFTNSNSNVNLVKKNETYNNMNEIFKCVVLAENPKYKLSNERNKDKVIFEFLTKKEILLISYIEKINKYPANKVSEFVEKRANKNSELKRLENKANEELERERKIQMAKERMSKVFLKGRNFYKYHLEPKKVKTLKKGEQIKINNQNAMLNYDSDDN